MPVILYDGAEEELMDTIEREFSWPPAEEVVLFISFDNMGSTVAEGYYIKNKATRVSAAKESPIRCI